MPFVFGLPYGLTIVGQFYFALGAAYGVNISRTWAQLRHLVRGALITALLSALGCPETSSIDPVSVMRKLARIG